VKGVIAHTVNGDLCYPVGDHPVVDALAESDDGQRVGLRFHDRHNLRVRILFDQSEAVLRHDRQGDDDLRLGHARRRDRVVPTAEGDIEVRLHPRGEVHRWSHRSG